MGVLEEREQFVGLVWVKFHIHSTTTRNEIIKLCEYCCLLYFSSLKLPNVVTWACWLCASSSFLRFMSSFLSSFGAFSTSHKTYSVYKHAEGGKKNTLSPQQALLWTQGHAGQALEVVGSMHYFSGRDVSLVKEPNEKRKNNRCFMHASSAERRDVPVLFACKCCPVPSEMAVPLVLPCSCQESQELRKPPPAKVVFSWISMAKGLQSMLPHIKLWKMVGSLK